MLKLINTFKTNDDFCHYQRFYYICNEICDEIVLEGTKSPLFLYDKLNEK